MSQLEILYANVCLVSDYLLVMPTVGCCFVAICACPRSLHRLWLGVFGLMTVVAMLFGTLSTGQHVADTVERCFEPAEPPPAPPSPCSGDQPSLSLAFGSVIWHLC